MVVVNKRKTRACAAFKFLPAEALGCNVGTSLWAYSCRNAITGSTFVARRAGM